MLAFVSILKKTVFFFNSKQYLTPPRISANHFLDALISDVVTGTTNGIDCNDDQGRNGVVL